MVSPVAPRLAGRSLRCILTVELVRAGRPLQIDELIALVEAGGHVIDGRPSKTVSDALRWEVGRGRVERLGRGRYAAGRIPESTYRWMRARARQLAPVRRADPRSSDLDLVLAAAHQAIVDRQWRLGRAALGDGPTD